jgi:putative nucleotidyltransferase with HDIG domain
MARGDGSGWQSRPHRARTLRLLTIIAPLLAAVAVTVVTAAVLPHPTTTLAVVGWWAAVLAAGALASHLTARLMTRLLPLAMLFDLTLSFPEAAPSRYRVAKEAWSVRRARETLQDLDEASPSQRAAEAALALIAAIDAHDRATRGHSERVRLLAELIAGELHLSPEDVERLRWAALLHDLGKLTVHPDILNKDGRPSEAEWEALLRHPEEGSALARPLRPWLGQWALAVAEHHERFDGGGYPRGLHGEEISLAGRVVAVADAYEAMTAHRSYNAPRSGDEARRELVAEAGTQFDPEVVRAFLRVSLPRRLRTPAPLAFVLSLPLLAWLRRLPVESTTVAASGAVAAVALVASGLAPIVGVDPTPPPVVAAPDEGDHRPRPARPEEAPSEPAVDEPVADSQPVAVQRPPTEPPDPPGQDPGSESPSTPQRPPDEAPPEDDRDPDPGPPPADPVVNDAVATDVLYLSARSAGDTRWQPHMDLRPERPAAQSLPNYDTDRNDVAGLALSRAATSPVWIRAYDTPTVVSGSLELTVFTMAGPGVSGTLRSVLSACTPDLSTCQRVAEATATSADWGGGSWTVRTIEFGPVVDVLVGPSVLALSLVAETTGDVHVAFGAMEHPSRLEGLVAEPLTLVSGPI